MAGPNRLGESNSSGTAKETAKEERQKASEARKLKKESAKEEKRLLKELEDAKNSGNLARIAEARKAYEDELAKREELEKDLSEQRKKSWAAGADALGEAVAAAASSLKTTLDKQMEAYVEQQESIAYNLNGSYKTASSINEKLFEALSGTGIVKQEAVYSKLTELVKSGIIYNVEQRAYLATLSEDLGMAFDTTSKALNRLINLQRQDISDERAAIEASLKTFLNQNYQTSLYIKEGFQEVSEALIEAQSLMQTTEAMSLEATVQTWLGSLSSVGMASETINGLAEAMGKLGSGDYEVLNTALGKLIALGASTVDLDIADIINNGLTSSSANALMAGVVTYMNNMSAGTSNAVKAAYAKVFGFNVSDLVAASKVDIATLYNSEDITTSVSKALLSKAGDYIYTTTKLSNMLDNAIYSMAVNAASNETMYSVYKIADLVAQTVSPALEGTQVLGVDVGTVTKWAPFAALMAVSGLGSIIGTISGALADKNASDIFNLLADTEGNPLFTSLKASGNIISIDRGASTSGSLIITNTSTTDLATSARTSAQDLAQQTMTQEELEAKDVNDVYTLLDETIKPLIASIPLTPFATVAKISEAANTVTIGNDLTYIQDMITLSAVNIQNIYLLLAAWSSGTNITEGMGFKDVTTMEWKSNFGWAASASNLLGTGSVF